MDNHTYIAIDLKSFYASVECVERNMDPLTTHLLVADKSRTGKRYVLSFHRRLRIAVSKTGKIIRSCVQGQGCQYKTVFHDSPLCVYGCSF